MTGLALAGAVVAWVILNALIARPGSEQVHRPRALHERVAEVILRAWLATHRAP